MKYSEQLPLDKGTYKIIVDSEDNALHLLIRNQTTMVFPDVWSWGEWVRSEDDSIIHKVVLTEDLPALYICPCYEWTFAAGVLNCMESKYFDHMCETITDLLESSNERLAKTMYQSMSPSNRERFFDWVSTYYYYDMEDVALEMENLRKIFS
jgi:hypothetical protein